MFLVTIYSQILLRSIRWVAYGLGDECMVSFVFEGRSRGFSTEHGFMLAGLHGPVWFKEKINGGLGDVPFNDTGVFSHQWNRVDITFLRPSHAISFFELLSRSLPDCVDLSSIPDSVLESLRIQSITIDLTSDDYQFPSSDVSEIASSVIYPNVVEDIPVRTIQFFRDFTGGSLYVSEGFQETRLSDGIGRLRLTNPVFGSPESMWCAMYLRDTIGGPRAQVVGMKVDSAFGGMIPLDLAFFHSDGERFRGDIGEDSLVSRVVPFVDGEDTDDEVEIVG
jgi:hypothetical protein